MTTDDDPGARAADLHEQAITLRESGDFTHAETLCREAVAIFEAAEGSDSVNLANALMDHARLLELLDRLPEAAHAGDRALAILHPWIDPAPDGAGVPDPLEPAVYDELLRLTVMSEIARASTFRASGALMQAEAGFRRALALAESHLPADDQLIVWALNGLGMVHKFQGRLAEAEPVYARALAIAEATGARDDIPALLHNLGGLAHARGDFSVGEPLARRSVELREARLGAAHPTTAADRAAWGALLEGLGRMEDAERAYADALAVFEARLGPRSSETASALTALAGVQRARGALDEAEQSYRRSLAIREAILAPEHFDIALTANNLAMLLVERGARPEARTLLNRARKIFTTALGPDHAHTRAVAKNIAALERDGAD